MLVKKVNEACVDVFVGAGWSNWSRFNIVFEKGRMSLKLVKGKPMMKEEFKQLYQQLSA